MELLFLYFWLKLSTLHEIASGVLWVGSFIFGLSFIAWVIVGEDHEFGLKPFFSWRAIQMAVWLLCFAFTFKVFVPTQKETAVLVAGYFAKEMAQTEEGKKAWLLVRKSVNNYLDGQLKTLGN